MTCLIFLNNLKIVYIIQCINALKAVYSGYLNGLIYDQHLMQADIGIMLYNINRQVTCCLPPAQAIVIIYHFVQLSGGKAVFPLVNFLRQQSGRQEVIFPG